MSNALVDNPNINKIGRNKIRQLQRKLAKEPDTFEHNMQLGISYFQKDEIPE